jgi:hypothetical protein
MKIYLFINTVGAVGISVAAPPQRDAVIDAARKLGVLGALGVGTAVLVGSVAAVVVAVAHPALLNTFAVGACKLVRAACFIWGNQTMAHNATHP